MLSKTRAFLDMATVTVPLDILQPSTHLEHIPHKAIHRKAIHRRDILLRVILPVNTRLLVILAHLLHTILDMVALGLCLLGVLLLQQLLMVPMQFMVLMVPMQLMVHTVLALASMDMVPTNKGNSSMVASLSTMAGSSSMGSTGSMEGSLRSGNNHPACQLNLVLNFNGLYIGRLWFFE